MNTHQYAYKLVFPNGNYYTFHSVIKLTEKLYDLTCEQCRAEYGITKTSHVHEFMNTLCAEHLKIELHEMD